LKRIQITLKYKENENFCSGMIKKLILSFLQTYQEKPGKSQGNPELFQIKENLK
jgi:hypothetical protein